jgi:hypothetical protein
MAIFVAALKGTDELRASQGAPRVRIATNHDHVRLALAGIKIPAAATIRSSASPHLHRQTTKLRSGYDKAGTRQVSL